MQPLQRPLRFLLTCIVPVLTIAMILALRTDIPWGDDVSLLREQWRGGLTLGHLFALNNEHIIFFTRLTLLADFYLAGGSYYLATLTSVVLGLLVPVLFVGTLRYLSGQTPSPQQLFIASGLLTPLYFNGNLLWASTAPVMLQHFFGAVFACGAGLAFAVILTRVQENRSMPPRVVGALLLCTGCAILSGANGALIFPAALITGLLITVRFEGGEVRAPLRWLVPVLLTGIVLLPYALILAGNSHFAAQPKPGIDTLFRFMVCFVGGPYWRVSTWPLIVQPPPILVLTTCGILAAGFVAIFIWYARQRRQLAPVDVFCLFMIAYVLLTALAGASARASLSEFEGLNKKYPPTSQLAWLGAATLLLNSWLRRRHGANESSQQSWVPAAVLAGALLILIPVQFQEYRVWRHWKDQLEEAVAVAGSGVYDSVLMRRLYYNPEVGYDTVKRLQNEKTGLGRRFPQVPHAPAFAPGSGASAVSIPVRVLNERPDAAGFVAVGNVKGLPGRMSLEVIDSAGQVVGYGFVSPESDGEGRQSGNSVVLSAWRKATGNEVSIRSSQAELARVTTPALPKVSEVEEASASMEFDSEVIDHQDYSLERIGDNAMPVAKPKSSVKAGSPVEMTGWAVDRRSTQPAKRVLVELDKRVYGCTAQMPRDDVASFFKVPAYSRSGFRCEIPGSALGAGDHEVYLRLVLTGGKQYRRSIVYRVTAQ